MGEPTPTIVAITKMNLTIDASILAHSDSPPHTPASFLLVLLNANLLMFFPLISYLILLFWGNYANIAACGEIAGPTLIPMVMVAQKRAATMLAI